MVTNTATIAKNQPLTNHENGKSMWELIGRLEDPPDMEKKGDGAQIYVSPLEICLVVAWLLLGLCRII
jgi:hypothetical protein